MAGVVSTRANPWVNQPKPNPQAAVRLFCFPYSGGSASIFYQWPAALPPMIETCLVELPGRGARLAERAFTRMGPLIESLAQGLLPYLDRPFAFFGHSLGALVSFELARVLRRERGLRPVHLFASGHTAPHLPQRDKILHNLPEPELVDELRRLNGTPDEVLANAELRQIVLPILRADFELYETHVYAPGEPLACPISAFGGLQDEHVPRADLEAWREHTTAGCVVRMFPGDHFFLTPSRQLIIMAIARELSALGR